MQAGIDIASIDSFFGDISTKFKYLSCIGVKGMWGFTWKDGELIGYNNFHEKREFMAIHLQKRKLAIDHALPKEKFCIVPNEILNGMENCMKIKKNSLFYTIDRMRKTYLKIYRDNQQIGEEGKLIKDELYSYCTVNGLFPPKKSGKLLTPLYALKRKFFWT